MLKIRINPHYVVVAIVGAILCMAPFAAHLANTSANRPAAFYGSMGN